MKHFYSSKFSRKSLSGNFLVLFVLFFSFSVSGQINYSGPYSTSSASPTPLSLGVGTNTISNTVTTPPAYQAWFDLTLPSGMEITGVTLQVNDPANISSGTVCFNPFTTCNPSDTWSSGGQAATPITSWSSPGTLPITSSPGVIQVISNIASNTTWSLVFTVVSTVPTCDIAITGISTTPPACPGGTDGSLTVTTTCPSCVGAVEYSLDNASWQASNTFTRPAGNYTVYVRDSGNTTCTDSDTATIAAGTDNTPPAITCPGNITVSNDAGTCGAVVTYTTPVGTDNCPGQVTTQTAGLPSGSVFPVGTTTNTFLVTDASGNTASCSFSVTVEDNEAPQAICSAAAPIQNVAIISNSGFGNPLATSLTNNGYTVTYNGTTPPSAAILANTDAVFLIRINGNADLATWVQNGGVLITEWDSNVWALNTANLINATDSGGGAVGTGTPVTFSSTSIGQTLGTGIPNPYSDGSATEFFRNFTALGASVEIHATRPGNIPVIIGDNAGLGYVLAISYDYQDIGAGLPGSNTEQLVLNALTANYNAPLVIQLDSNGMASITVADIDSGSTDNCGIVSSSVSPNTFDCSNIGSNIVTLTVTDASGNSSTCTRTIIIEDNEAPVITCVPNATRDTDPGVCEYTVVGTEFDATFTDNCSSAIITNDLNGTATLAGEVLPLGDTTVVWIVDDGNGQTATCTTVITIEDNEAPAITCVTNQTVNTNAGTCTYTHSGTAWDATATDNCSVASITYELTGATTGTGTTLDGVVFNLGETTVTWTATDGSNNTTVCSYTVIVEDIEAPAITCTTNQTIDTDAGVCNYTHSGTAWDATATDNCSVDSITYELTGATTGTGTTLDGVVFNQGVTTVTWTATDGSTNTAVCNYTVTVEDNEAPIAMCVAPFTIQLDANGQASITVADIDMGSTDNCNIDTMTISQTDFDCSHIGDNTVTLTITDDAGNTDTCTTVVTVEDTIAPEISCVANQIVDTDAGVCTYTHVGTAWDAVATDNAGAPLESYADINNWSATASRGTTSITYETVNGEEFLRLGYNGNGTPRNGTYVYTNTAENTETITFDWNLGGCHSWFMSNASYRLWVNNTGNIIQTLYNGGSCGFSASGSSSFAITAGTQWGIIVTGSHGDSANLLFGQFDIQISPCILTTSYELTGATTGTGTTLDGVVFNLGETMVTWTATDSSDNTAVCSYTVTVEDNEAPVISCVVNQTIDTDAGVCTYTHSGTAWDATATDNCSVASITYELTGATTGTGTTLDGVVFNQGVTTVTWTATDGSSNTDVCSYTVTVEDNEAPVITCVPNQTIDTNAGVCTYTHSGTAWDATATDNCTVTVAYELSGATTGTGTTLDGVTFNLGETTVTWTATDGSSNTDVCSYTVTVEDNEAPVITCVPNQTIDTNAGVCTYTHNGTGWDATATDNCSVASITYELTGATTGTGTTLDGVVFNLGETTVTWTTTDGSDNTAVCSYTVTVEDNILPTVITQNITVSLDANGTVTVDPSQVDNGSFDNCAIATMYLDIDTFTCADLGENMVILYVEDTSGNLEGAIAYITVVDDTAPIISCPADVFAFTEPGECQVQVTFANPSFIDNCSSEVTFVQTEGPSSGSYFPIGTTTVSFDVIDESGNTSSCSFTVTVEDNQDPVAVCQNITIELDANGEASITAEDLDGGSTDNCSGEGLTYTVSQTDFDCSHTGENTIIFTVTDQQGNSSTCTAIVTVVDNSTPEAICVAPFTIELDANGTAGITLADIDAGSTDNCEITEMTLSQSEFTCADLGENEITLTVTDASGNVTTCITTVTVTDDIAPVVSCIDFTLELGENGAATLLPENIGGESTDNCGITITAIDIDTFDCSDIGTPVLVTYFASDASGNTSSCTAMVTVVDLLPPVITCPGDFDVDPQANGTYILEDFIAAGQVSATDNCTDPVEGITQSPAPGTLLGVGTHTISFTAEDEYGNEGVCTFELTVNPLLGDADLSFNSLTMYPNPAATIVHIGNPNLIDVDQISIYDIRGRLVVKQQYGTPQNTYTLDVSTLSSAMYMVTIQGENKQTVKRLIVK